MHPGPSFSLVHCRESPCSAQKTQPGVCWADRFQRRKCPGLLHSFCCLEFTVQPFQMPIARGKSRVAKVLAEGDERAEPPQSWEALSAEPWGSRSQLQGSNHCRSSQAAEVQPARPSHQPPPQQSLFTLDASRPHNSHTRFITRK